MMARPRYLLTRTFKKYRLLCVVLIFTAVHYSSPPLQDIADKITELIMKQQALLDGNNFKCFQGGREMKSSLDINSDIIRLMHSVEVNNTWTELLRFTSKKKRRAILQAGALSRIEYILRNDFNFDLRIKPMASYDRKSLSSHWNLLYTNDVWPYKNLTGLKSHQLVNHIPGILPVVIKSKLASLKSNLSCTKKAFDLPKEREHLLKYIKSHPDARWLRKSKAHRGIKMVDVQEMINMKVQKEKIFFQEFLSNPLLIENRKFDIGIHAVFTSANPLRLYADYGEWTIKMCLHDYYPFDGNDTKKYIEGNAFLLPFEYMPLAQLMAFNNLTRKEAFLTYMQNIGHDAKKLELDILDAFTEVGAVKDREIFEWTKTVELPHDYKNQNYFEFIRFDVGIDTSLKPWIIEANMTPDMGTSVHGRMHGQRRMLPRNSTQEEIIKYLRNSIMRGNFGNNIIRAMLILVGVPDSVEGVDEVSRISDEDIKVDSGECISSCQCSDWKCSVCWRCLSSEDKLEMKRAYIEHYRKGKWRRVIPKPFKNQESARTWTPAKDELFHRLTDRSKRSFLWFRHKCLQNKHWCS